MKQLIRCKKLCLLLFCVQCFFNVKTYEVKYAVNVGGDAFTDSEGINYEADENQIGTKITWGPLNLAIAPEADRLLYQTGRYSTSLPFGYDIQVPGDGHYVLIIKMGMAVTGVGSYILNAFLNGNHTILSNFDQVKRAGGYPAHDEYTYFTICNKTLMYKNQVSDIIDNRIRVEFRRVTNYSGISAIVLLRGRAGEKKKLISSNSNTTMFFDPENTPCYKDEPIDDAEPQNFDEFINQKLSEMPKEYRKIISPLFLFNINVIDEDVSSSASDKGMNN